MNITTSLLACFALLTSYSATADTLLIDIINKEPANNASGLLRPHHGQTMLSVESHHGAPIGKSVPIGNPPITRWTYPGFSVYFEHNYVIHSVVNKPKQAAN
ncbi:MAG: hypothetical protein COB26_10030 [Piscirickettsiaceae bacterium]|nr:MAG: hypothetical protein COB89_03780 [Piscirickettsiaceae bacterium]PCI67284.1 MAG: hypothetical protein COB26_10030 [Piscirickettsiaceae bacterium]